MRISWKSIKTQTGFTLLEVVIAMAIVAIALVSLVESTGNNVKNTAYLRDKVMAHWVAQNVLNELLLKNSFPNTGSTKGKSEMAGQQWQWQQEVKATPDKAFRAIDIKVFLGDSENSLSSLTTYVSSAMEPCEQNLPQQASCHPGRSASTSARGTTTQ